MLFLLLFMLHTFTYLSSEVQATKKDAQPHHNLRNVIIQTLSLSKLSWTFFHDPDDDVLRFFLGKICCAEFLGVQ